MFCSHFGKHFFKKIICIFIYSFYCFLFSSVVAPQDKSMSQGLSLFITSLLALIPGPIIFGHIIDNTCLIWKNKCGRQGNCLLYDPVKFRYFLHLTSAAFISISAFFNILIWYYGRDLDLYGDSNDEKSIVIEKKKEISDSHENQPLNIYQ